jgi:hypothetical protein
MNDDTLKTLSDNELAQLIAKAQTEITTRTRKRKEDAIARIKELAGAAGVTVSIKGARGRPPSSSGPRKPAQATQAR